MTTGKKDPTGKTIIITEGAGKQAVTPVLLLELDNAMTPALRISAGLLKMVHDERKCQRIPLNDKKSLSIFNTLPAGVQHLLLPCTQEAMVHKELQLKEKFLAAPLKEQTLQQYVQEGMQQYLYHTLQQLRPLAPLLPWYCQVTENSLEKKIRPATVNNYSPLLSFELVRTTGGALRLLAFVTVNGQSWPLSEFEQYGFLLRSRGELFILSPADARALGQFPQGYQDISRAQEGAFLQHALPGLAERYPVNKNILLSKEEIDTPPQCNIWLSELNNSFLMLRIQWQYDRFTLDATNSPVVWVTEGDVQYEIKRHTAAEQEMMDTPPATGSRPSSRRRAGGREGLDHDA